MKITEKNKYTLDQALNDLKGYNPSDSIWDLIDLHLDQSDLDTSLHEAIDSTVGYIPPDSIWGNIESGLEKIESESILKDGIKQLEGYNPPDTVWDNIEKELPSKDGHVVKMSFWKKAMAVAAVGLLFWMSMPYFSNTEGVEMIAYSQETIELGVEKMNWDEDEADFAMVSELCETGNIACLLPEFKALKAEMDDLNAAKNMLKAEISDFETDDDLLAKLTRIEIERGDVLKQMISLM